ncbi:MAG: cell division/cell wall cluster transcriptional repressor MraZ [Candidatus Sungbacteria bacterium RIFCSPHIGHO2_02_FULL_49_12]|uniref:Transcriptional regulator MraZ n=1 Tax=Candidatus Sungbacteria bacterium RIFCSPHIGHO2_02_FULL_49_12 TaxID=1802271 RepID=A0A1G2KSC0_9BACT|nr:MAG: cell division/cell wall cluster transcriptional repressor MraZ [Candidatus Sungbacteria bacterium RIFCSPHIGHO2_02_FULL_49_12]
MFIGEYQHAMDEKGRVAIPVKFRKSLAGGVVVTRGIEAHLYIYPKDIWETLALKLSQLPINQANSRAFSRHMLGGAVEAEIDSQGRILIPEFLRQHAAIKNNAVMVGLYDKIEVWAKERWEEYRAKTESNTENIAEQLGELGAR